MTFAREGDRVILDIATEDYDEFMVLFGDLLSNVVEGDKCLLYRALRFLNALNRTNDEFVPYEIPAKYRPLPRSLAERK